VERCKSYTFSLPSFKTLSIRSEPEADCDESSPDLTTAAFAHYRSQAYIPLDSGKQRKSTPKSFTKENVMDMGFIAWIVVGLIAGWLAGQVMKGGGYGVLVDIILGILGGILGGWLFGRLGIWPAGGMLGAIIVAFVGAVILVAISRALKRA
jgi:uncharacterized membrane protein YeaQ/YmgE (transglycosylase-associated protein family)